jgi:hypothetical protein
MDHSATLDGASMAWPWALPFIGILLSIAIGPLLFPKGLARAIRQGTRHQHGELLRLHAVGWARSYFAVCVAHTSSHFTALEIAVMCAISIDQIHFTLEPGTSSPAGVLIVNR